MTHDYAEIYTPSGEKVSSTNWECNKNANGKPPTPPLHRFPSWESRIYRVANEGLSNSAPPYSELSSHLPQSVSFTGSGYYDVSCPVYATVKGVSECRIFCTNPQILFLIIILLLSFIHRELVKFVPVLSAATLLMTRPTVRTIFTAI